MTNEESRERLEDWSPWQEIGDYDRFREALDMAIKALEQQPCEDCISRAEAINVVHKYFVNYLKLNDDICLDGIRSLPSVTPNAQTGHWIKLEPYPLQMHEYECSECGNETDDNTESYCSECGAKMTESEGKK